MVGDQVGDHLGVGLRGEDRALLDQPGLERDVVLDDPVDDDVHLIGGVEVRVGVLLGHPAVGGPAGVPDARLGAPLGHRHRGGSPSRRPAAVAAGDRAAQGD